MPLRTPADLIAALAEQINAVRADANADPQDRARTVAGLAAVMLRAMEQGETQARLEAVERVLKLRRDADRAAQKENGRPNGQR